MANRGAYGFNGTFYNTREEAEAAREQAKAAQEAENRQRYAQYIDAYSVGFDKNKYDALIASGQGVSQISDNEANYIRSKFTPSYSTKYKNSATDQYLASVGLPPSADLSKYREQYTNYTSGGGLKDNYGNLTSENWSKINELWSRDWQYGLSDEDARRKYYGLAPTSYDSEYADTLLDDELKAAGLPPSKLLNGKLGEKYSQWISDNDSYNEFMSDVVRTKVKNSESRTNPVMPNIDGSLPEYTIEQAIQDTLATDKWRLWGNEHYGVKQDMPDLYSGDYTVMDKYGYTPQKDERGNIVYDYDKWNKDSIKAAENNAKIDADEFAITAEKAQVFYDKYASDAKAEKEAEDELITSKQFREITLDELFNTTAGCGDVPVLPTQNWLTEEQRLRYQPVVDKLNTIAKEEGWDAATEYWNSGSLQRDLVNSDIVASYRQEYEDVPSYADKTDEEILNEYYGGIAKSYGMSSEQEAALRNGSLTLSDYMSDKVNTDADAWEFANARMEREYGSKSDVEKQLESARQLYRTSKNSDLKAGFKKQVKELEKTLEEYDKIREGYYIDAIGYSKSFTGNEASGDLNEKVRDVITPVLTQKYDSAKGTNDRINLVLENATDEEKQKVLYLADVNGTGSVVILGREAKSLTDRYIESLVSKYSNEKTRERIQGVTDWYSNLSGAGRFATGVSALIAAPIVQPVESLFNLVQQTGSIATGRELYTQDMYAYSQDVLSAISGAIQERHGTVASTAYQMIPSIEQSAGAAVAAYFTGGATEWITLAAMGMESYSSTVEDALLSGRSSKEAYALGLAAGSAEVIFEKVSLDKFVKDINVVNTAYQAALSSGKAAKKEVFLDLALDMLNHQAVQGLVEASEEGATSIANLLAERLILGYDTDYEQKKQHYMDAGMSEEEASEKAGMEIVNSVMTDMELGFVSGALMTFGSDIVQTSATTVGFDKTGTKRFLSGVHNLSAIDNEQAMKIAKTASENGIDADGELSVQGAQNIVDSLLRNGADASTLAYVQNEMTSTDTDRDVQTVFDSAIIKTRNENLITLTKAAERVAARSGITDNMSEKDAAEYKLQISEVTNDYLLNLTQTLLTTDKAAIAESVEMARDGYISDVMRMTGASTKAGISAVNEYIMTTPEGVIESGATPFMSALKLAGMSNEQAAAFYANTASALVSMTENEGFASAFIEVFGGNAAYVSEAVRNACLNSCSESSIGFVDVALAAIGTYDSISDNHLIKALAGNMDSRAYVTSMLAAAQTSKDGSSRAMYDNISMSGVTGSKLDVLSATTYYDNMKKSSRTAADKYVQSKNNDAFMTSEEVTELVNEYNNAKQNVASKQELILSHQEHNAQTMATANNIVERHMTAYNALAESELYTDANGNKVQTVSADLADQAASTYAALNDAINARDNLARANADRLASAQADLDAATEKMRKVSRKYKMAMNRHAAAYVQLVGSQIESLKGGANPSNIEFDNIVSRAVNGTREDLNDVKSKLVAAEKRQAVSFGNEIGVEVHITDFTDEFLKEHNATNVDPKTLKGFEQKGVVYLNESFFNDADVGYGTREVITHEFGHVAEKSTKYYGAYSAFAKQYMQSKYGVVADMFEQKYGTNELVAEFAHTVLFQDPNAVKALCSEAPVMSMRLYTWLSSISSKHNGSLAQTNSLRKAQINFAKALKASKVEIRNGVQSAVSVLETNNAVNTTDNIAAEQESANEDNYVPEAPPEDTAIAYGEEADVSNRAETSEEEPFYAPDDYRFDEAYTESDVRTVREADNEAEAETEKEEEYIPPEDYRFDEAYTESDARNAMDRELSEDDDFSDYRFDEAYVESDARTYDMSDFFEDEQADGLNAFRSIDESYDITKSFKDQLNDPNHPYKDVLLVGATPDIYRMMGFPNLPLTYTKQHAAQNREATSTDRGHVIDDDALYNIMDYIKDPAAVFYNSEAKRFTIVTDLKSKLTDDWVVIGIAPGYTPNVNGEPVDSNMLSSIHGKEKAAQILSGYLERDEKKKSNGLLYANKEKMSAILQETAKPQLLSHLPTTPSVLHTLADNGVDVKRVSSDKTKNGASLKGGQIVTQQFERWFGKSKVVDNNGRPLRLSVTTVDKKNGLITLASERNGAYYASVKRPYMMRLEWDEAESVYDKYGKNAKGTRTSEIAKLSDSKTSYDKIKEYADSNGVSVNKILRELRYDGIKQKDSWSVFEKNQVKRAGGKNVGTFDRRTNNPSYMTSIEDAYNEFREGLHDEEYMRLAKKYMDGSITLEEEEQLEELVESAAIAAGVMNDELGAIDLYHGVDMGFGFTVFEPQPSGYAHYATTSPFVARGYAGVEETSPRELWRQPIKKNKMVSFANDFTNEELIHNAKAITGTNFEYHDGFFQDMSSGELMTKEELFYYLNSERRWDRGILHLYAFPGDNQHVVDAGGKEYYKLNDTYGKSTDDIMMRSRNKASTVWFKNIKDGGFHPEMEYWNEVADEIGVQPGASNYLKSADLVTTLRGTIIPLSKRFDFSRSDIRFYTPINDAINEMSDTDYARYGNPRVMLGSNGLMVARDVSVKGFEYGNPTADGNRNIGMVYHASKFSDGTNAFMYNDVALRDCTAVVVPKGKAYADVRNIAADNGVNVVTYNENEPTEYENALKRAASSNSDAKYFVEGIEDLMKRYGTIEQGANPRVDGRMLPRQTTKNNRVSRTMQTLAEAPITSDEGYEEIQRNILNGTGTYTPTSNAKTLSKAQSNIDRLGGARNALQSLNSSVATNEGKSTDLLALAESLYMDEAAMQSLTEYEREQLRNNMCIVAGDAGRALQLMNELKRSTPEGHIHYIEQVGNRMAQKYEKHTGKPTKLTLTNDELDAYRKAKTPEERNKIDKQVSERWSKETEDLPLLDKLRNWRYFSMLGNPRTHFRNMVGNALMYPVVRVKDTINTGYQRMFGVDKADRTTTAITKPMDAQTRAYVEAAKQEAIPLMQNVSSKYIESLNKSKKIVDEDGSKLKKVWNELTADVPSSHITNGKNAIGRALNWLSSVNSNALEMEDALALGKRFKSSFAQQLQAKGLDVTKVTPEQRQQMMNYAMQEALIATFRDASKLSDAINNLEQTNKGTQFFVSSIMPFKKTPINIAKRSIEYSPIGVVQAAYKGISNRVAYNKQIDSINSMNNISESERKARINAAENTYKAERIAAIDRLSAGTTGSIAFIIGMIAAANGWVSVARKDDKSDTFENALGRNNYSLNIGDVSIDLSAFSPAAIPFIMGASLQEATDGKNDGDETMLSSIMSVLSTTLDPITEMTVLSGIGDALQNVSSSYDNPSMVNWMSGIATNAATSYVGQFVPTIVGQAARIADPYARSYSAGGDYWASAAGSEAGHAAKSLQNKIPGLAWLSEPKVDLHGEPVKNYTNFGAGIAHVLNNTILPATIKFDQKNEIDDELIRLYGVVDSDKIFPTKPGRSIGYVTNKETNKSTSLKLENDKEYTQYQKEYGQAVYDALYDLVNSMAYARMTDEQKASAVEDVISDAQKTVRNIWKAKLAANLE